MCSPTRRRLLIHIIRVWWFGIETFPFILLFDGIANTIGFGLIKMCTKTKCVDLRAVSYWAPPVIAFQSRVLGCQYKMCTFLKQCVFNFANCTLVYIYTAWSWTHWQIIFILVGLSGIFIALSTHWPIISSGSNCNVRTQFFSSSHLCKYANMVLKVRNALSRGVDLTRLVIVIIVIMTQLMFKWKMNRINVGVQIWKLCSTLIIWQ